MQEETVYLIETREFGERNWRFASPRLDIEENGILPSNYEEIGLQLKDSLLVRRITEIQPAIAYKSPEAAESFARKLMQIRKSHLLAMRDPELSRDHYVWQVKKGIVYPEKRTYLDRSIPIGRISESESDPNGQVIPWYGGTTITVPSAKIKRYVGEVEPKVLASGNLYDELDWKEGRAARFFVRPVDRFGVLCETASAAYHTIVAALP